MGAYVIAIGCGAASIAQVFLLPIAGARGKTSAASPQLAVVNLTGAFVAGHLLGHRDRNPYGSFYLRHAQRQLAARD